MYCLVLAGGFETKDEMPWLIWAIMPEFDEVSREGVLSSLT